MCETQISSQTNQIHIDVLFRVLSHPVSTRPTKGADEDVCQVDLGLNIEFLSD